MISTNLKECRKVLKLNQASFAGIGMSREYISDVERGKSTLSADKEQVILERLLLYSLSKQTAIPLELDVTYLKRIGMNDIYQCYSMLMNNYSTRNNECLDELLALLPLQLREFAYFLNYEIHICYSLQNSIELAYEFLKNALDIAFLKDFKSTVFNVESNLIEFASLAFKLDIGKDIILYYKRIINYKLLNNEEIKPYTYYNVALFEKIEFNFDEAYKYIQLEYSCNKNRSFSDDIDFKIIEASLLLKLNKIDLGMSIYKQIVQNDFDKLDFNQKTLVSSNVIYFVSKYSLSEYAFMLISSKKFILKVLYEFPERFSKRHKMFANLGMCSKQDSSYEDARHYFNKAFEVFFNSYSYANNEFVELLYESMDVYFKSNEWNFYLKMVNRIDLRDLNSSTKKTFLTLLLKIFYLDTNRDNEKIVSLRKYIES